MSSPLNQQVILITGASAGIGAALAKLLAQRFAGIRLVLAARNATKLESVADQCRKAGAEALVIPTDMQQLDQVEMLAQKALNCFGRVDVLINNAGYGQMGPVELVPMDSVRRQFEVNVLGVIALTQKLIPVMRANGGGRIINVSSLGGRMAFPFGGLYSASKFALEGLSDTLRMELEPFNIKVSVVEPGPVATEFVDVAAAGIERAIANPANTPYRAAFAAFDRLEQRVASQMWSAERTAEVILRALSDRRPRPRYIAATGGNILVFLMTKLMPTRLSDKFWQRFYGIDQVARDWKSLESSL